jgi:hypothetical protein
MYEQYFNTKNEMAKINKEKKYYKVNALE